MMVSQTLEERVAELEAKMARILGEEPQTKNPNAWIEQHFGAFKDNPYYDAAMERGAEYRRSLATAADKEGNLDDIPA